MREVRIAIRSFKLWWCAGWKTVLLRQRRGTLWTLLARWVWSLILLGGYAMLCSVVCDVMMAAEHVVTPPGLFVVQATGLVILIYGLIQLLSILSDFWSVDD